MCAQKAAPPRPEKRSGTWDEISIADRKTSPTAKPSTFSPQAGSIRAELIGSDQCSALGMVATGHAPLLTLCRLLIEAGHHLATPLEAYRGETLALRVRSIGEAARLRVATHGVGFEPSAECTGALPVRGSGRGLTGTIPQPHRGSDSQRART
jgi:hypothetical protein